MGCDIHAFVEYEDDGCSWSLSQGKLNIPRDHELFGIMALGDGGITSELLYPQRGIPGELCADARDYFYASAQEVQEIMEGWGDNDDGEEFQPEEYARQFGEAAHQEYLKNEILPEPEFHSHSWLNLAELKLALARGELAREDLSIEFRAILASMEVLAGKFGEEKVRLVFCFDGGA